MNVLKDYLESDYAPIPYTENIWLPKCFNDRKFLTAYVRKSTRLGIWLNSEKKTGNLIFTDKKLIYDFSIETQKNIMCDTDSKT